MRKDTVLKVGARNSGSAKLMWLMLGAGRRGLGQGRATDGAAGQSLAGAGRGFYRALRSFAVRAPRCPRCWRLSTCDDCFAAGNSCSIRKPGTYLCFALCRVFFVLRGELQSSFEIGTSATLVFDMKLHRHTFAAFEEKQQVKNHPTPTQLNLSFLLLQASCRQPIPS